MRPSSSSSYGRFIILAARSSSSLFSKTPSSPGVNFAPFLGFEQINNRNGFVRSFSNIITKSEIWHSGVQKWALPSQILLKGGDRVHHDRRAYSEGKSKEEENQSEAAAQTAPEILTYYGPFSGTLKKVKLLSLSSCFLSVLTAPVITFFSNPDLSPAVKGFVIGAVVALSTSTTAALHWFTGPYIHKLTWTRGSEEIEVELLTWLATKTKRTIRLADVRPAATNRPFATFSVNGKFYFVDPEKFPHKDLLGRLSFHKKRM